MKSKGIGLANTIVKRTCFGRSFRMDHLTRIGATP